MRKFLLLVAVVALAGAPLAAQTRLQFNFYGSTYEPDPAQGLWYASPDLGTYARVNGWTGYEEIAGDARDVEHYYLESDRFMNQSLVSGYISWNLPALYLNCIGEGRDGFIYAEGGGKFYRMHFPTRTYTILGTGSSGATDFAADVDGTLYGVGGNQLFRYDTETGARTLVVTLSQAVRAFGISHDGRFWGIESVSYGFSHCTNKLYHLNPVTGVATFVMDLPNSKFLNYAGMASEAGPHQPINSVLLSGPGGASAGALAAFSIAAAPPNSPCMLLASWTLGTPFYGGQPFDLGEPRTFVASGRTNAAGMATLSVVVPRGTSGRTILLEAGVRARGSLPSRMYDSNVHSVAVQ
jgi:hypothetical protein